MEPGKYYFRELSTDMYTFMGLGVGKVTSMYREMKDADLVLAEEATLELLSVFAKGVLMIHEKEVFVKGTFE